MGQGFWVSFFLFSFLKIDVCLLLIICLCVSCTGVCTWVPPTAGGRGCGSLIGRALGTQLRSSARLSAYTLNPKPSLQPWPVVVVKAHSVLALWRQSRQVCESLPIPGHIVRPCLKTNKLKIDHRYNENFSDSEHTKYKVLQLPPRCLSKYFSVTLWCASFGIFW